MPSLEKLLSIIDTLNQERVQVASQGWYLQHCWLVQVKPGGNARTDRKYWQVRSRKALFDGKKLKHLKPELVEDYKAAIERGRQLAGIDRQIEKLTLQLQQLAVITDSSNSTPLSVTKFELGDRGQPKDTLKAELFTNLTEQERQVKEVLAKSQILRASLRQSIVRGKTIGMTNTILKADISYMRSRAN
ncbi:hypothetical protein [Aliterella atlantica]|uniref:Uncharacterized protein n=1 Tax=Aliterella atlantica CENA595 TaxID=1618023 RepID=A0A0D8ZSA4_9CYAN|nr:hypothetical protein [Aliterella atlantica]KJH71379.1 hypothetical protein UH38_12515 [Aliterella atlantica CENA595]